MVPARKPCRKQERGRAREYDLLSPQELQALNTNDRTDAAKFNVHDSVRLSRLFQTSPWSHLEGILAETSYRDNFGVVGMGSSRF